MKLISSEQNPIFGELKKLLTSKGIHKQNKFLLWGEKFVAEILRDSPESVDTLILGPDHEVFSGAPSTLELSSDLFTELDIFGTKTPFLVCRVPALNEMKPCAPVGLELLVAVSEPSNLGTIIRSAASFGVKKIILLKESASPFHPRAVRSSAGSVLKMQYEIGPSIEDLSPKLLEQSLALDMKGENLSGFKWPKNSFLLVGEEGRGIPKNMKIRKIQIQTEPNIESLNAATAISIAMYSYYSQCSNLRSI